HRPAAEFRQGTPAPSPVPGGTPAGVAVEQSSPKSASAPAAAGPREGTAIIMPHGDLTVTEAKVVKWIKRSGETVRLGEPVVEVETDKAVTEIESPSAGVLDAILAPEGTVVALGQQLATVRPA
ncbi:MAG: lipoyl domain-containing protein, partial [Chloroflexota bacterium]|nr:lipoyl domain-containing protein [Chloroflexota bacterium]